MKRLLILLVFWVSISGFAQKTKVINVVTHNRTTIICDPATGSKSYIKPGIFPSIKTPIRKMTMIVTLGSPDSLYTAHWDYLDHIKLRKKDKNGESINYELGRMLTPYGSVFNKGWQWQWKVDVTDFAPLLRDNVDIEYVHSGYEDKTVGWALTIDFEIVSGPPVVTPLGITPLWNAGYKYGDPKEKIGENLLPIDYVAASGAEISRIRIQHTGHGMDKPKGCSEFCQRWRELKVDGKTVDHRNMWKDCGDNPLYPQGGTWIYDRAYWCPGDLQVPDIIDVKTTQGKHRVSLEMEPYEGTGNIQAVENISSYLFQYSKPTHKVDVAVDGIMVPNNEQQYTRLNPASFNPRFVIRNLGSENLKSVTVTYGTEGFPKAEFHWKGNLKFNQTAEIVIPGEIKTKEGMNKYTVKLSRPNGGKDAWMGDNELITSFVSPEVLPTNFVIEFLTNNKPKENKVFLIGEKGDTIFHKLPSDLEANTLYKDTISLKEGKYELFLTDSAGNGLQFWYEPQNGDGYLRMFDMKGDLIHAFESDCGNGEKLSFTASKNFVADKTQAKYAFSLYPRLVIDKTELNIVSNKVSQMTVLITVNGVVHEKHEYAAIKNGLLTYSLGNLPKGRIILEVLMNGVSRFKGRLNK
ncbi:peptide-N-glycosidase F-related protein [Flavobacterium sp. W1B]|uniref:peptide-N-glycosidase F-related protein n=1 Tax=Flavobacterium sp. W1B TaxID=3394146 RepID=UPI0039BC857C